MADSKPILVIPTRGEVNGIMQYKNGSHPRITLKPSVDGKAYECPSQDAAWLMTTGDFKEPEKKKATKDKTGGGN